MGQDGFGPTSFAFGEYSVNDQNTVYIVIWLYDGKGRERVLLRSLG